MKNQTFSLKSRIYRISSLRKIIVCKYNSLQEEILCLELKEKTGKYRQQVSFLETRVGERQKGISSQTMRLDEMKGNIRKRNDMYSNRVKELNELEDFFIENVFNENEQLLNVIFEKKKMTKDEMIKIYRDAVVEKQCVFNNLVLEYKELESKME